MTFTINIGLIDLADSRNNRVISNVPFLLGIPASVLSQIGKFLSLEVDTFYSTSAGIPTGLSITGGGENPSQYAKGAPYNVMNILIKDSLSYQFQDNYLKNSLTHFFVDCVTPMIDDDEIPLDTLMQSQNIWGLLKNKKINKSIMTVYYGSQHSNDYSSRGKVMTCQEAYQNINNNLRLIRGDLSKNWGKEITVPVSATLFQEALNYATHDTHYTPTAGNYLEQAPILNLLSHSVNDLMAIRTNPNGLLHELSIQKSIQSIQTGWSISSAVFQSVFGYLYAVLQAVVYAMVPLVIVFSLLPGLRVLLVRRYLQLLAWFPVTLILLTVVNNVLAIWSSQMLGQIWGNTHGLTLNSRPLVSDASKKLIDVGGWLMTTVPMMAWGLVSGLNLAVNSVLGVFTGGFSSEKVIASAVTNDVSGNMDLDNQHYHNMTADQVNTAWSTDLGVLPTHLHESTTAFYRTAHLGGLEVVSAGGPAMQEIISTNRVMQQNSTQTLHSHQHDDTDKVSGGFDQSTHMQSQTMHDMTSWISSEADSGVLGAAATYAIQKHLAHDNFSSHTLSNADIQDVANNTVQAVLKSSEAVEAQSLGHKDEMEALQQQSSHYLSSAFNTLSEKLGGGVSGEVLAGSLVGLGVSSIGATLLTTLPEDGLGLVGENLIKGTQMLGDYVSDSFSQSMESLGNYVKGFSESNLVDADEVTGNSMELGSMGLGSGSVSQFVRNISSNIKGAYSLNTNATKSQSISSDYQSHLQEEAMHSEMGISESALTKTSDKTEMIEHISNTSIPDERYYDAYNYSSEQRLDDDRSSSVKLSKKSNINPSEKSLDTQSLSKNIDDTLASVSQYSDQVNEALHQDNVPKLSLSQKERDLFEKTAGHSKK